MSCCGSHSSHNQSHEIQHNVIESKKSWTWLKWTIVIAIIVLLVFSFT